MGQPAFLHSTLCAKAAAELREESAAQVRDRDQEGDGHGQDADAPAADVCGLGVAVVEEGHVHCLNTSFVDVGVAVTVFCVCARAGD